jgi:hypothetical protein
MNGWKAMRTITINLSLKNGYQNKEHYRCKKLQNTKEREMKYLYELICPLSLAFNFCIYKTSLQSHHYLKTFHRKSRNLNGPYDELTRGSFYEWFAPTWGIKSNLNIAIKKRTTSITTKIHSSIW